MAAERIGWEAPSTLPGVVFPTQLAAADFNGDGKMDLAVLNTCGAGAGGCFPQAAPLGPGTVTILLGKGDGTFAVSPRHANNRKRPVRDGGRGPQWRWFHRFGGRESEQQTT